MIIEIIRENSISTTGIHVYENISKTFDGDRVCLEGVFVELFASVELNYYYVGQISNISSRFVSTGQALC